MKETTVLITNNTPLQITILGRVIGARAINQPVQLINVERFKRAVESSYPNGQLTISLPGEAVEDVDLPTKATSIKTLELAASVEKALAKEGITTVEQLVELTAVEVVAVKGIAEATLGEIEEKLKTMMGLTLKEKGDE